MMESRYSNFFELLFYYRFDSMETYNVIANIIHILSDTGNISDSELPFIKVAILEFLMKDSDTKSKFDLESQYSSDLESIINDRVSSVTKSANVVRRGSSSKTVKNNTALIMKLVKAKYNMWRPIFAKIICYNLITYETFINNTVNYIHYVYNNRVPNMILCKAMMEIIRHFSSMDVGVTSYTIAYDIPLKVGDYNINCICDIGYGFTIGDREYRLTNGDYYDLASSQEYLFVISKLVLDQRSKIKLYHDEPCQLAGKMFTLYELAFMAGDGLCTCKFNENRDLAFAIGCLLINGGKIDIDQKVSDGALDERDNLMAKYYDTITLDTKLKLHNGMHPVSTNDIIEMVMEGINATFGKK
jgi:hypothetical protein